jgi:hypothetical protein
MEQKYSIIGKNCQRVFAKTSSPHQAKEKAKTFSMSGNGPIYIQNGLGVNVELYIDGKSSRERRIEKVISAPVIESPVTESTPSIVIRRKGA